MAHAVSASSARFEHMPPLAALLAALLHAGTALALWGATPLQRPDLEEPAIEVTLEQPKAAEEPPPPPPQQQAAVSPTPTPSPPPAPKPAPPPPPPPPPPVAETPPAPPPPQPPPPPKPTPAPTPPAAPYEPLGIKPPAPVAPEPPQDAKAEPPTQQEAVARPTEPAAAAPTPAPEPPPEPTPEPPQRTALAIPTPPPVAPTQPPPEPPPEPILEKALPPVEAPPAPLTMQEVAKVLPPPPPPPPPPPKVAAPPPPAPHVLQPSPLAMPQPHASTSNSASSALVNPAEAAARTSILDTYRLQVANKIAAHRVVMANQSDAGMVEVNMTIARDGRLVDISIRRSSGHPRLDAAVLEAARSASPYLPPPSELPGSQVSFTVPMGYGYRRMN